MNARKIRARVVWAVIIIAGAFFLAILLIHLIMVFIGQNKTPIG